MLHEVSAHSSGAFFIRDVERDKVNSLLFTLRAEELM